MTRDQLGTLLSFAEGVATSMYALDKAMPDLPQHGAARRAFKLMRRDAERAKEILAALQSDS